MGHSSLTNIYTPHPTHPNSKHKRTPSATNLHIITNQRDMPSVNSAKGVLVVDPLEARGVRFSKPSSPTTTTTNNTSNSRSNGIYVLFQIDTVVHRTKVIKPESPSCLKWLEGSQTRFDINPGCSSVLQVFVMQRSPERGGLPLCIGKGELNLIDAFYQKESDHWVRLAPYGQLDVELTFYELVPMLPSKQAIEDKSSQLTTPTTARHAGVDKVFGDDKENIPNEAVTAEKLISSVDRVFEDDVTEERSRLKKLASKLKRRCKPSLTRSYSTVHHRKTSQDMLIHELRVSPDDKKLPKIPPPPLSRAQTSASVYTSGSVSSLISNHPTIIPPPLTTPLIDLSSSSENASPSSPSSEGTTFSRNRADLSQLTLSDQSNATDDLDLGNLPYSASSIGTTKRKSVVQPNVEKMRMEEERERQSTYVKQYERLSPEMYSFVNRLEKGLLTKQDFKVDEGASEYNGDGTWSRGCLRDTFFIGDPPRPPVLPPKIPVGMRSLEYFVLNKSDYLEYFRTVKAIKGI